MPVREPHCHRATILVFLKGNPWPAGGHGGAGSRRAHELAGLPPRAPYETGV